MAYRAAKHQDLTLEVRGRGDDAVRLIGAILDGQYRLVAAGLASSEEIEQHLGNVAAGLLDLATSPMISAWGRRPG